MTTDAHHSAIQELVLMGCAASDDGGYASPEHAALFAGVSAGDAALAREASSGVLKVFVDLPAADRTTPELLALRTYAELRRVLLSQGFDMPASSLAASGFTAVQIARFDLVIAALPSRQAPASNSYKGYRQLEIDR